MKILANIYSLDDIQENHIIACLRKGRHVIGRGGILKIKDKRISRSHALIVVYDDKVTITSTHSNPSLFKSAKDHRMKVLKENVENDLNDGDQFALTNEEFWFRVRLGMEPEADSGKRPAESNDSAAVSDSKRLRLSNDEQEITAERCTSTIDFPTSNQSARFHNDSRDSTAIPSGNDASVNQNGTQKSNDATTSNLNVGESQDGTTSNPSDTAENHVAIEGESIEFKIENFDESDPTPAQLHCNETLAMDDIDQPIKEEPVEVKTEPNLEPVASGSGANSGDVNRQPPRTRCWYGQNCYRKNPHHRVSFSHPGDEDYGSDSEDNKPECPYGMACYRKNPDHRREYKHVGKPAAQPRNLTVNVLQGCPFCSHCNGKHGGGKSDYESDVDEP